MDCQWRWILFSFPLIPCSLVDSVQNTRAARTSLGITKSNLCRTIPRLFGRVRYETDLGPSSFANSPVTLIILAHNHLSSTRSVPAMDLKSTGLAILATLLILIFAHNDGKRADAIVVNTKIDRIIDLSSQLVKITERIHLSEIPESYTVKIDPKHKERLAFIEASIDKQTINLLDKLDGSYEADLRNVNSKQPLVVVTVYTQLLEPYPAEINQNERQLVRYQGSQVTLSPYLTKTITTKIKLPQSSRLESFTKASKMTTGSNKLVYGPLQEVQPDTAEPLTIHFENNNPFVAVKNLARTIELSPWAGSINVINEVKVEHVGAKLKGPFSRFDYQRDHTNGISSVRNFLAELPKASRHIYFRDGIGNISTSNVRTTSTKTIVAIKPRFPLFGGWVTDFYLGYAVPMSDFVNEPVSGNNFRLSIPFSDILYENMFIENALVKVILPSGASNVEVKNHLGFERLADEINYSYLDVVGRPVVVLKKKNIVAQHLESSPLVIRYDYSKVYMLQEPILLMAVAVGIFLLSVIYSKLSPKGQRSIPNKLKPE